MTTPQAIGQEWSLARPLADDVPVRRELLRLPDGYQTLLLRHAPPAPAGRPVLYAHGIQSHPGWFVGSAQALARAGHEVFQVARRGSGPADADRGHAASARQLLADVEAAVAYVRAQTGADRLAMLGVSWGGKLLTAYALARPDPVASLTLVAPGIAPRVGVGLGTKLAVALACLCCPRRTFEIPLNDVALFTDNPAMREYLRTDRHRLHRATAGFLAASARLDARLARRASAGALTMPTTLVLAGRDRIIHNARARQVLHRLTAGRVRVIELDAAHTIEFEEQVEDFHEVLRLAVQVA